MWKKHVNYIATNVQTPYTYVEKGEMVVREWEKSIITLR